VVVIKVAIEVLRPLCSMCPSLIAFFVINTSAVGWQGGRDVQAAPAIVQVVPLAPICAWYSEGIYHE